MMGREREVKKVKWKWLDEAEGEQKKARCRDDLNCVFFRTHCDKLH